VYASNGVALAAAVLALGAEAEVHHVPDDPVALRATLARAIEGNDLVVTAGGVSVGDHDHVRPALQELGTEERFWRVSIKPGKPVYYGCGAPGTQVFGLPGNPVSVLVTFHLFVRPALRARLGLPPEAPHRVTAGVPLRAAPERDEFVRVRLEGGVALPLERQGSHMASGLALADALARVPGGAKIAPGEAVEAIPLRWLG
jgi:molybdopterin molybdotransferase